MCTHTHPSNVSNGSDIKYYFKDHNKKCWKCTFVGHIKDFGFFI